MPLARLSLVLLLGLAGCWPQVVATSEAAHPQAAAPWAELFDGNSMKGWRIIQGDARIEGSEMVLLGSPGRKATVMVDDLTLRDGAVEVVVRHDEQCVVPGPYTVALRLKRSLDWSCIYCVSRRDNLEMCRGSSFNRLPSPQMQVWYEMQDTPESWRFEMHNDLVDCYRFGQKVIQYVDLQPAHGTIAITADGCRLHVVAARYRPAAASPDGRK